MERFTRASEQGLWFEQGDHALRFVEKLVNSCAAVTVAVLLPNGITGTTEVHGHLVQDRVWGETDLKRKYK